MYALIAVGSIYLLGALLFSAFVLYGSRRELRYGTILNGLHWSAALLMGAAWPVLAFALLRNER